MSEEKAVEEISVSTQVVLKTIAKSINDLEIKANIILQTCINEKELKGTYKISEDFSKLELIK